MNKPTQPTEYLVYAYLLHKGKYPFGESLMWASSKEEAHIRLSLKGYFPLWRR